MVTLKLFKSCENAVIINTRSQFKHVPSCRLKRALYSRYANEDHQRDATLSCINTILTPVRRGGRALKMPCLFASPSLSRPSLHPLVRCVNTRIGWPQRHAAPVESLLTRQSQLATHPLPPSIYFSLFFRRSSFSFSGCRSLSPPLIFLLSPLPSFSF